ncbi:hypothetical protein JCGZ_22613 [Jatropha curcas]|uniref:CRAL-TRIO domain-containing protein n=2 Tax=Jatropha curcas TaxID=180498 RepID=A0A067JQF5_JATCU|nr:hypothetical protein JCGZ_22613 [Jatropha curcas]
MSAQMEQDTAQLQQQETVTEKAMETETVQVEEKKHEDEDKKKEVAVVEERNIDDNDKEEISTSPRRIQKSSSFKEESESDFLSDLKEHEKKALLDLRSKIEEAILQNKIFEEKKEQEKGKTGEDKDQKEKLKGKSNKEEDSETEATAASIEETAVEISAKQANGDIIDENNVEKAEPDQKVDRDIAIWGVPLLPSKGDDRTDVLLLKFLRAREFKANDAFEMLKNSLQWRKENKIDSILEEDLEADLGSMAYIAGNDRDGHPICYNIFAVLGNDDLYGKAFEEKRGKFMRSRIQLMEKTIQKLDFNPGGVSATLQINDLKNTPLPTKKELRIATKKAVDLLQDNYPEFVSKNIFINVPFWYYAYFALFSPSLSQRAKNKLIYARTARVTDTLLKYISASEIPVQYGGLKRENDAEFSVKDDVKEAVVKAGSEETIEIQAVEVGSTLIWDVTVSGWEVNYKEEFVPTDEGSYTIIVQKGRRIAYQEGTIRNTFTNKEPGKIVITIENGAFKKKKILYRYKIKNSEAEASSSSS